MLNENIKVAFQNLKCVGERDAISPQIKEQKDRECVKYLESLISEKAVTDFEDIGFCYWNISDSYALLRDSTRLCENHKRFYCHCQTADAKYLYWPICDGTQHWALEEGGFGDVWWSIYQDATEKNERGKYPQIEFEVHRMALSANPRLQLGDTYVSYVSDNIDKFLRSVQSKPEYDFYDLYYYTQKCLYFEFDVEYLFERCQPYLEILGREKADNKSHFLCGEWESFQVIPSPLRQARLSINASVNALIYKGYMYEAKSLYEQALEMGLTRNHYIEKRLK